MQGVGFIHCIACAAATSLAHLLVDPPISSPISYLPARIPKWTHPTVTSLRLPRRLQATQGHLNRSMVQVGSQGLRDNDAHCVRSTGDDIYMFIRQYEFQNPPTATTIDIVQPYVWGCRPPITIDDMIALNPLSITEPPQSQWHSHLQSKGDPDRATNGPAFVVRHPKGQNGDTIVQAMAAVRRAIAHGSEPSADDLVRFLQHEASSYTCLCLDEGPCGKKFERRHRAVDHVRGHFGLRAYPCRGGCGKVRW